MLFLLRWLSRFIASLGGQISCPELVGASVVAGVIVVLVGALGLTGRLVAWIPAPIVLGLVAGAVMPYIADIFTALGDEPVLLTPLTAGPDAGGREVRHWSVYISASAFVLIAPLAGVAADLPVIIPLPLLLALAGLSLVGVLVSTLQQITRGPLLLGPMFAFAIALSRISLLGIGPFFWSLIFAMGISLLLEQEALKRLRASVSG